MPNNRDNFSPNIKRILAERVGWICSFPGCGQVTVGPGHSSNDDRVNNGIAAHITAAALGGPRYDGTLTPEQRSSIDNGIWMCRDHGNLIDADQSNYEVSVIKQWKIDAEKAAHERLSSPAKTQANTYSARDLNILSIYSKLFNYNYIVSLQNELFRAKVSNVILNPLYETLTFIGNPSYEFNNASLEMIRQELNNSVQAFYSHFGEQCAGNIDYYDYIDLNKIRLTRPESVDVMVRHIEKSQFLAYGVGEVAKKLLNIHSKM